VVAVLGLNNYVVAFLGLDNYVVALKKARFPVREASIEEGKPSKRQAFRRQAVKGLKRQALKKASLEEGKPSRRRSLYKKTGG
jgi:hypothetical protein